MRVSVVAAVLLCSAASSAQQKGQWVPGQFGLNAGVIPELSNVVQLGLVRYDQWQITDNSGIAASVAPCYSAHALGLQANFGEQKKGVVLFFKYHNEQNAKAHPEGDTFVFGGSWTIRLPKS